MKNMEDLSGMSGMWFSLIAPGAMRGQSLNTTPSVSSFHGAHGAFV